MTYLRRAFKYLIQITLIFVLMIGILMLSGFVSKDIGVAFRNGWTSIGYIFFLFAVMSAAYPFFGYGKRSIHAQGDPATHWQAIERAMAGRGYEPCGGHAPLGRPHNHRAFPGRFSGRRPGAGPYPRRLFHQLSN